MKKTVGCSHADPEPVDAAGTESEDGAAGTCVSDGEGGYLAPEPVCKDEEDSE